MYKHRPISVLISDGEGLLPLKVLRCLGQAQNLKINILSREKWNPIRLSRHHSGFFSHTVDEYSKSRLDIVLDHARRLKVDVILPVDLPAIQLLSTNREEVQSIAELPPLPTPETIAISSNKWRLTEILSKENISFPKTILFQEKIMDKDAFEELTYPVLTKPLDGSGGTGIQFFQDALSLRSYLENEDRQKRIIIQSFIVGYDLICNVLCVDGEIKAHTIQRGIRPGAKRFEPPSSYEFILQDQVYKIVEKLMRALKYSGVACIDLRYDEVNNEPKVLEINPRYWGSVVASLAAGVNFPLLACQLAMGLDFPTPQYNLVRYIKPEVAFKLLIDKYLKGDTALRTISETGLPYTFGDPGPEIIKYFNLIKERILRH